MVLSGRTSGNREGIATFKFLADLRCTSTYPTTTTIAIAIFLQGNRILTGVTIICEDNPMYIIFETENHVSNDPFKNIITVLAIPTVE